MIISFFATGPVTTGWLLGGMHRFPEECRALSAMAMVEQLPQAGVLVLELEVDGNATGVTLTLSAGGASNANWAGNVVIPAGGLIRWRAASFTGTPEQGALSVSLAMSVQRG